jgi:NTE family protein
MTRRALVLGGGGLTGIGWEWGVLAGLAAAGIRLGDADLVVGTSAGSVVGAQVANGLDPEERYTAQLTPPDGEIAATLGAGLMLRLGLAMVGSRAPQRVRQRIGRLAHKASAGASEAERVAVIASRLPVKEWPAERRLWITAVDTATGGFRVFDRDAGVSLVTAVAASCAVPGVWPPVTAGDRQYMDGGVRSGTNADLAAGYERIVVLAPLPRGFGPMTGTEAQVAELRRESSVALVTPDADALRAFGRNVLDPARRAPAARAGLAQAASVADSVRAVWESS